MQDLVGIVRRKTRCCGRSKGLQKLRQRAAKVQVTGNREYNPGWHTALDLHNLLTVSEAVTRAAHRAQGKPRRPVPRRLPDEGHREVRQGQHDHLRKAATATMQMRLEPIPPMPDELKEAIKAEARRASCRKN